MKICVDADACPVAIKEILFRAAQRKEISVTLVANQPISCPRSKFITMMQVPGGFDVADNEIVRRVQSGELVVINDIPRASEVIDKGAMALSPSGAVYRGQRHVAVEHARFHGHDEKQRLPDQRSGTADPER